MKVTPDDWNTATIQVLLNGKPIEDCIEADDAGGYAVVLQRHWRTNELVEDPNEPGGFATLRLEGQVEIRRSERSVGVTGGGESSWRYPPLHNVRVSQASATPEGNGRWKNYDPAALGQALQAAPHVDWGHSREGGAQRQLPSAPLEESEATQARHLQVEKVLKEALARSPRVASALREAACSAMPGACLDQARKQLGLTWGQALGISEGPRGQTSDLVVLDDAWEIEPDWRVGSDGKLTCCQISLVPKAPAVPGQDVDPDFESLCATDPGEPEVEAVLEDVGAYRQCEGYMTALLRKHAPDPEEACSCVEGIPCPWHFPNSAEEWAAYRTAADVNALSKQGAFRG